MEEIIKEYLEGRCIIDADLKEKYNPELIEKCCDYIVDKAKEYLDNKNGAIRDEIVYNWAVDYFLKGEAEIQAEKDRKEEEERIKREKENEERKKAEDEKKFMADQHKEGQISLFDFAGV